MIVLESLVTQRALNFYSMIIMFGKTLLKLLASFIIWPNVKPVDKHVCYKFSLKDFTLTF